MNRFSGQERSVATMVEVMKSFWVLIVLSLSGCAHTRVWKRPVVQTSDQKCSLIWEHIQSPGDPVKLLNAMTDLSRWDCNREVVVLGAAIREHFRDKVYEISNEAAEFIASDGTVVRYVLEGYERNYLGLLMAISYVRLGDKDSAQVELRRVYEGQKAQIEKTSEDPVSLAMQAVLWETLGESGNARVHWRRLWESPVSDEISKKYAAEQIKRLDARSANVKNRKWNLTSVGTYPRIDSLILNEKKSWVFDAAVPMSCSSKDGALLISTQPWLKEIRNRYSDRSTLDQARSVTRGTLGLSAAVAANVLGWGFGIGACYLILSSGGGSGAGEVCGYALAIGAVGAEMGTNAAKSYTMPSFKHWQDLPAAVLLRPADAKADSSCEPGFSSQWQML